MNMTGFISPMYSILFLGVAAAFYWAYREFKVKRRSSPTAFQDVKIEPLPDFDWTLEEPAKLRPFKNIYHITMGIQNCSPCQLITIDKDYLPRIMLRRSLLSSNPGQTHGYIDGAAPAVNEVYSYLLSTYLPARYPTIFQITGSDLHNRVSNGRHPLIPPSDPAAALRVIGETVEEDIFLLRQTPEGQHESIAFLNCFPSGFDGSKKLGKLLKDIHGPVPGYEKIGPGMERFFARLAVGKPVRRMNWGVQIHDTLFTPGNHDGPVHAFDGEKARFRVELQTLMRFPETKCIMFSFKTYLYPLSDLKKEGLGGDFADAIQGLTKGNVPKMWGYKGADGWGEYAIEYLRQRDS